MSDDPEQTEAPAEGASEFEPIPVSEWVQHPVSDSSDYLDRPVPDYDDMPDDGGEAPAEPTEPAEEPS